MNILQLFNKQSAAEDWIEAMRTKEMKKTGEYPKVPSSLTEDTNVQQTVTTENAAQTVCTSENFTHTDEETQKIRRVHDELAGIIFKPALAI